MDRRQRATARPRELDDPQGLGPQPQSRDLVEVEPAGIGRVVARHQLGAVRLGGEIDQGVVVANPAIRVALDQIDRGDHVAEVDREPGLLEDLATRRVGQGLAQLLRAAG